MIRPLSSAALLLTLLLSACGSAPPDVPDVPAPSAAVSLSSRVTLRVPSPRGLTAQYVNRARTTRFDVKIGAAAAHTFVLGSPDAPCGPVVCTLTLGNLAPGSQVFTVSAYGVRPSDSAVVLISEGSVTSTLLPGTDNALDLTLAPVGLALDAVGVVPQLTAAGTAFERQSTFTVLGGHSLPAYYDVQATDSVGDVIAAGLLCSTSPSVRVTDLSDAQHPQRFRAEVTALGSFTLSVRTGADCATGQELSSFAVTGQAPTLIHRHLMGGYQYAVIGAAGDLIGWGAPAPAVSNVVALADNSSSDHGVALTANGNLQYWNYLSNGVTATPAGLSGVVGFGAGYEHTAALKSDGTVLAWGGGIAGSQLVPANLADVVNLAVGFGHNLALKSDGTVVAWGENSSGQSAVPAGLADVVAVAAGQDFSLALKSDGTVVGWGNASLDQIAPPAGLSGVVALAAGGQHALALKSDGTVVAWGNNNSGQTNVPAGLSGVVAVVCGVDGSVALKADGSLVGWGAANVPVTLTQPGAVQP